MHEWDQLEQTTQMREKDVLNKHIRANGMVFAVLEQEQKLLKNALFDHFW